MLLLSPHMRILLAVDAIDFRKGIPGLMGVCKKYLQEDPFSGVLFVFRNNKETAIKALIYDGQGFWLIMERHYLWDCQINVFHSDRGHPVLFLYIDHLRLLLRRLGGQI